MTTLAPCRDWPARRSLVVLLVALRCRPATLDDPGRCSTGRSTRRARCSCSRICLVFGGLAAGYDLLFGRTGLLSFGHALYFAAGVYGTAILVTRPAAAVAGRRCVAIAGDRRRSPRCSARSRCGPTGIAFAMVTLAFAQVGAILVARNPGGLTGGEEGLPLDAAGLPRRAGRRGEHGQPVLARAGLPRRSWCSCVHRVADVADRPGARRAPRRRAPGRGARASTRTASSWSRSSSPARLAAARRRGLRAARRRRLAARRRPPT